MIPNPIAIFKAAIRQYIKIIKIVIGMRKKNWWNSYHEPNEY